MTDLFLSTGNVLALPTYSDMFQCLIAVTNSDFLFRWRERFQNVDISSLLRNSLISRVLLIKQGYVHSYVRCMNHHAKRSLKALVIVTPKEGWACVMAVMTTTKAFRGLLARHG